MNTRIDIGDLREKLANAGSETPRFWRSLDEAADTDEFRQMLKDEFPAIAKAQSYVDRREFLALLSASLALAGLNGCAPTRPEKIVPYVEQPEHIVPGKPLYFATAMPLAGYGFGVLVESHMGRPTKVEGNPEHPASLGATDAFAQASILGLYDPDRSPVIKNAGRITTWDAFVTTMVTELDNLRLKKGEGLRFLSETVSSPTQLDQIQRILEQFPRARWHRYDPLRDNSPPNVRFHLDRADVVLSLDADFLMHGPGHVRYSRDFARRRSPTNGRQMNRLYVLESTPTITGASADHRFALRSSDVLTAAVSIAARVMPNSPPSSKTSALTDSWLNALTKDLRDHPGTSLVIAGEYQPAEVHRVARELNAALGNVGKTVEYNEPPEWDVGDHLQSLKELTDDIKNKLVDVILVIGGNPVYTAPADLEFSKHYANVRVRTHLASYEDETSAFSHWHIPESHYMESWGDIRAFDGTITIQQPLIEPLYATKSVYELLSAVLGDSTKSSYEIVQQYWQREYRGKEFEKWWRKSVHDGVVTEIEASRHRSGAAPERSTGGQYPSADGGAGPGASGIEVVFRPDPTVLDGRFSNNAWLQELPKHLTKVTWDNVALISPATAQRLGIANEDVIEIHSRNRSVRAPAWVSPGHAAESITLFLGYGRTQAGQLGSRRGYDANAIRTTEAPWFDLNAEIRKTGQRYSIASTQQHHSMEGRPIVRSATIEDYRKDPGFAPHQAHVPDPSETLYPEFASEGYAWGMAIDLNACTGCSACVVACQSENNIPSVGKDQVARSREMQWLRVDRYYQGNLDTPRTLFQPMLCMHCEKAPCEPVCPVGATTHSAEGLNEMTYNRCVGTRYCSNNCPYKVRRFNFFEYWNDEQAPVLKLLHNPDVTVRSRGVMEKCTYCVQRINHARIEAKREDRSIRDGEVVTACQAVCPSEAIVFGNIADPESRVSKLKAEPRNYGLLAELNTHPRTTYLAKLTNPNPELNQL